MTSTYGQTTANRRVPDVLRNTSSSNSHESNNESTAAHNMTTPGTNPVEEYVKQIVRQEFARLCVELRGEFGQYNNSKQPLSSINAAEQQTTPPRKSNVADRFKDCSPPTAGTGSNSGGFNGRNDKASSPPRFRPKTDFSANKWTTTFSNPKQNSVHNENNNKPKAYNEVMANSQPRSKENKMPPAPENIKVYTNNVFQTVEDKHSPDQWVEYALNVSKYGDFKFNRHILEEITGKHAVKTFKVAGDY